MKKEREKKNKKRKKEKKEREDGRPERPERRENRKKERKINWVIQPPIMVLYRPLSRLYVFIPTYLVKKTLLVDVSVVGQTTSNMVSIIVWFLPLVYVSSEPSTKSGPHCAELRR